MLNYGYPRSEIILNLCVDLPKSNLEIESICDLIPGALITEREKQEFLGIKIIGIPDDRRLFLPEDLPKGIYPWRKDETGADKLYRNLHEVKK
jgi:Ni,Fe-hydrogenase III component G